MTISSTDLPLKTEGGGTAIADLLPSFEVDAAVVAPAAGCVPAAGGLKPSKVVDEASGFAVSLVPNKLGAAEALLESLDPGKVELVFEDESFAPNRLGVVVEPASFAPNKPGVALDVPSVLFAMLAPPKRFPFEASLLPPSENPVDAEASLFVPSENNVPVEPAADAVVDVCGVPLGCGVSNFLLKMLAPPKRPPPDAGVVVPDAAPSAGFEKPPNKPILGAAVPLDVEDVGAPSALVLAAFESGGFEKPNRPDDGAAGVVAAGVENAPPEAG